MRILVVDDTPKYREMAVATLSGAHAVEQAGTYEEAARLLGERQYDGVLTDLFFPSETDWLVYWSDNIAEALPESPGWAQERGAYYLKDFMTVQGNPSGLMVALECKRRGIPCRMLSQGEHHNGDLGKVRMAVKGSPELSLELSGRPVWDGDPLPKLLVYRGVEMDKSQPSLWWDAAAQLCG